MVLKFIKIYINNGSGVNEKIKDFCIYNIFIYDYIIY